MSDDVMELNEEEQQLLADLQNEPAPVPEPAPEVEAPPVEQAPAPEPYQQKMVPLAALQQTRSELKEVKARAAQVEAVKQEILAMRQQMQPKVDQPKYDDDPFGAIKNDLEAIKYQNTQRDQLTINLLRMQAAQEQQKQFMERIVNDEMSVRQAVPDWENAFNHLINVRTQELQTLGVHDPEDIAKRLQADAMQATMSAIQSGQSPAEALYKLAYVYGYRAQAQQAAQPMQETDPHNVPRDTMGRFASVQAGQQAAKSLQGGVPQTGATSVEAMLKAEGADFDRMWGEMFPESKKTFI